MPSLFRRSCLFRRKTKDFFCPGLPPHKPVASIVAVSLLAALSCTRPQPDSRPKDPVHIEYRDGIARRVLVPAYPKRIISLAPNVTEVLYLLGAGPQICGVTRQCDWPDDVRNKPKIGDLLNPNHEVILAAQPDLVIASTAGNDQAAIQKLTDLGLPVFVTAPRSVGGIFSSVAQLGRITGHTAQGERLVSEMKGRLAEIDRRLSGVTPQRVFLVTWFEPLLAPGRNTFENDVLRLARAESISADIDEFYPRFSLEQVLLRDPDVILTVRHSGKPLPDLNQIAGWQKLRAVRNGRILVVGEVLQHPSPRFVEGVEELARKLYPERFQ
jgi:iron complex transport system substrate-binding protein